jgi:lipid II isoglutaminyl synthase (glutamine-hydrolysing)
MPAPAPSRTRGSARARNLRDAVAVVAARITTSATRLAGRNATAMPGIVADRISPGLVSRLAADLGGVCLVSGTNGKTSTSRFLAHVLASTGRRVIANASGANLEQGVTSALGASATPSGRLRNPGAMAVLEVDEAALPRVAARLHPTVIVMTNLFRDQLDRFGETDHLVRLWATMLQTIPSETVVVYCADDPRLAALLRDRSSSIGYSLVRPVTTQEAAGITPDVSACPVCGAPLAYSWTAVGHLGDYACDHCGFRRPEPRLSVVSTNGGLDGQTLGFRCQGASGPATGPAASPTAGAATSAASGEASCDVGFPGLGNAYNAAAAVTAAAVLGVDPGRAIPAIAGVTAPFARFENLQVDGRRVVLTLIKNPPSLGELTRILIDAPADALLFVLSDNFQDGRDVSWYWDANPAAMVRGRPYVIAGRRATDFAVRLKYELVDDAGGELPGCLGLADSPAEGLARAVDVTPIGGTCVVISTYTALLALRETLVARGLAPAMPR